MQASKFLSLSQIKPDMITIAMILQSVYKSLYKSNNTENDKAEKINQGYFFTKKQSNSIENVTRLGLFNEYLENTTNTFGAINSYISFFGVLSLQYKFNKFENILNLQNKIAKFFADQKNISNNLLLYIFAISVIYNYVKLGYEYQQINETDQKASLFTKAFDIIYPKKLFSKAVKNSHSKIVLN